MAIRIRVVNGKVIAICAACSVAKPGDIYLDDAQHLAVFDKAARDFNESYTVGLPVDAEAETLVDQEESNNPAREWWDKTYASPPLPPELKF